MIVRFFFKKWIYFFCLFHSLFGRVFFSPGIDDWLWYSSTIEYPLEFYFYNKRSNFCWDIGIDYRSRFTDTALVCKSFDIGNNLSVLFHGAEDFILSDVQPLPDNIYSNSGSEYVFVPDYFLSENTSKLNVQVSKDFLLSGEKYVHSTLRCVIPFATQSIVNIASGNMLYNTNTNSIRHKSYREIERHKNNNNSKKLKEKKIKKKKIFELDLEKAFDVKKSYKSIISPYVQLQKEGNNNCFAIQGNYFLQPNQSLFNYIADSINFPFIVYNKNAPSVSVFDSNNSNLSVDKLSHSYSIISDTTSNNSYYNQLVSYDGQLAYDTSSVGYAVQNSPYQNGLNPNSCIISLYSYGNSVNDINNQFFVQDDYGVNYSITTMPEYIYDVSVGDIVSTAPILIGNGRDGTVFTNLVSQNNLLRLIATANYGQNSSLDPMWSQNYVNFTVPPVVVQKSQNGFPGVFGRVVSVSNLRHYYNTTSTNGIQFDSFADSLKNNQNNINPRVTVLNEDGTFYDANADYAILWYQNNYTNLFNTPNDILNNIYITTALDNSTNVPSDVSDLISKKIGTPPSPDPSPCCDKVVEWVEKCIYKPIVENMNDNLISLQEQIWSLTSIQDTIVGNLSPIVDAGQKELSQPCNYPLSDSNEEVYRKNYFNGELQNVSKSIIDSSMSFKNGIFGSMNYDGFHRTGLGDILLEFICGSYFYSNTCLLDFYAALECPTAENINQSKSYLAVGLGNNGHYVGRIGLQGAIDIEYIYRLRFTSRAYLEHGFNSLEKIAPHLEGYPIFNFLPVKMDTLVGWNGGLVYFDGSLYTNDYSGCTISYQYWKKAKDLMVMMSPFLLTIKNTGGDSEVDERIMPSFDELINYSAKHSHTFGVTFFSRITNETFINAGCSRILAGNNVPQVSDFYCSLGISY